MPPPKMLSPVTIVSVKHYMILMPRSSFAGRQRSSWPATERGREKVDAVSGIQSPGLPVGERRQDHRVRRRHCVHEAARTEVRGRNAAAIRRGGLEHRARRQPRIGSDVISPFPLPLPCGSFMCPSSNFS